MTHSNQYNPFVITRLFAGMFGSVPSILGASTITDLFFLHEPFPSPLLFRNINPSDNFSLFIWVRATKNPAQFPESLEDEDVSQRLGAKPVKSAIQQ